MDDEHDFALSNDVKTPPGWGLLTELTLRAMAETYSASGTVSTHRIKVRGVTLDLERWNLAAMRVKAKLMPGMDFVAEIAEIQPMTSLREQCITLLRAAWRGQSIAFAHGSHQVNTTAYGILDELVQLGADCPGATIAITGHTDNSGNEAGNIELSQARAAAVATYFVERGISAGRLSSSGAGSARPLLDENNARARQLNRRIEMAFNYPRKD